MFRNKSVDVHQFAMVPKADIPRSSFDMQHTHKTTFDAGYLVPVYLEEVLPGDTLKLRMTAFARLATPIFPLMDNMYLESFFFFVPNRLVWENWKKFMGEQVNPGDSTSYVVPAMDSPHGGYAVGSIYDHFGIPPTGQVIGIVRHSSLPLRAYNRIWNEWFRDENLQNSAAMFVGDGDDDPAQYALLRRGKRHDYFTSCLPWPQKGSSVSLPLGTTAAVKSDGNYVYAHDGLNTFDAALEMAAGSNLPVWSGAYTGGVNDPIKWGTVANPGATGLYADLSTATAATINQLRQAFQIQKLLERDARGGTRYTELVRAHFGVVSPDARLQRPEYLGGGSTPVTVSPIAQTSGTSAAGTTTPMGTLAAMGTALANGHGFTQSFTEHGFVLGLVSVRADLTYQQGLRRLWSRSTKYDYYWPAFAQLGEQAVLNKEIYCIGGGADEFVFGYQERWAEYRYNPSMISGLFRSTSAGTLDGWHVAQRFLALPVLNDSFIQDTPPVSRVVAVGSGANGAQFLCDMFFDVKAARPLPMYSVPGLIDHF